MAFSSAESGQDPLMLQMRHLGYDATMGGVCFGLACMTAQAILVNDLKTLRQRLELLHSKTPTQLDAVLDEAKNKSIHCQKTDKKIKDELLELETALTNANESESKNIKTKQTTLLHDQAINNKALAEARTTLEIHPFFNGILLYNAGDKNPEFFSEEDRSKKQEFYRPSLYLQPSTLSDEAQIQSANIDTELFTKEKLLQYIKNLTEAYKDISVPVTFLAGSYNHATCIAYDPKEGGWLFIDANKLPQLIQHVVSPEDLTEKVWQGFAPHGSNGYLALTFQTLVNKNNLLQIEPRIKKMQEAENTNNPPLMNAATQLDTLGVTALHLATYEGHIEKIKQLVKQKANVFEKGEKQISAFETALILEDQATIEALIDIPTNGSAILCYAVKEQRQKLVESLLEQKADPNLADASGNTPLAAAISTNNLAITNLLLANGADPNLIDENGLSPLVAAIGTENIDPAIVTNLLAKGADPNLSVGSKMTPLDSALEPDPKTNKINISFVQILLENKADPNKKGTFNRLPLHKLMRQTGDNEEAFKLLLANGADLSLKCTPTQTLLEYAKELPEKKYYNWMQEHLTKTKKAHNTSSPSRLGLFGSANKLPSRESPSLAPDHNTNLTPRKS